MTKVEIARAKVEQLTRWPHGLPTDVYEALVAIVDAIEEQPGPEPDPEIAR